MLLEEMKKKHSEVKCLRVLFFLSLKYFALNVHLNLLFLGDTVLLQKPEYVLHLF